MDTPDLKELADRARVKGVFLCTRKSLAVGRNGKPYLNVTLANPTGSVEGRVWDQADAVAQRFHDFELVRVDGTMTLYQGRLQLHVSELARVEDPELTISQFLPTGPVPAKLMWADLVALVGTVGSVPLRALLEAILADPVIAQQLMACPAAKSIHHAYMGGLLDHTLSVARLTDMIAAHYARPQLLDRDLAVTGAILHDLGKTQELSSEQGFNYTDAGRLVGHIVLGVQMIDAKIAAIPDFPAALALQLRHILLAHHGELEHGSPKRPKMMEAFVVHYADLLDCQAGYLRDLFSRESNERWTSYQKLYDRYFFNRQRGQ
ncbi:MAG TPA: HD domain-containing protein [Polyangia bacterium]|jgi:3'-5' exoribonuclease